MSVILRSLRIPEDNVTFVRAELTRPELRILRVPMECSLQSTKDLSRAFGSEKDVPNQKLPPTLVYSGNRNGTLDWMKVINKKQGVVDGHKDPYNTLIRRYHACTGDMDKDDTIGEFEKADFPMIACTMMALGLGQNWKHVRRVIIVGRGDPSCICQMMGCCSRNGKPGLVILFMEKKRKFGLNTPEAIAKADKEDDDVRMDSLAIIPICLRITFSVDNLYGYIPMDQDNPNYLREESREEAEGFEKCRCSNCAPEETEMILKNIAIMLNDNFDAFLDRPSDYVNPNPVQPTKKEATRGGKKTNTSGPNPVLDQQTLDSIKDSDDIDDLIGGETMDGEAEMLHRCVVDFRGGVEFTNYKNEQERYEQEIEKAIQRIRRIPEAAKLSKQKKQNESVKQKRPTAAEAVENKKRRTEEKMAKEKLAEREKEAKAKKWAEDSAFIELRKAVHGTGTH
ncbi:hypothetical protein MJO28_017097 [Puccinia striiformis f. sp. tritici]|nr:hypothetical protein MJO28_017097 [Puccinia striiformis f. sp. tritici]